MLTRLAKFLGVDRAIYYTLLGRVWSMSSGVVSLWLVSHYLTPAEQGFYYTFAGILAVQVFFELGMGNVIMQFASHEIARLRWNAEGMLEGDPIALGRLRSFFILHVKWYAVIALLIVMAVGPIGWEFLRLNDHDAAVSWHGPWLCIIITAALNILISPILGLFEAGGKVAEVARLRMFQALAGSLLGWVVLIMGFGLFALAVVNVGAIAIMWLWLRSEKIVLVKRLLAPNWASGKVSWRKEIWPFQWKISISWMSGYLIFQLFVPLLFAFRGAVEAGQMGMSLSIANAVMAIPMAWMNTKVPLFGSLIAKGNYKDLDSSFFSALWRSLGLLAFLSAALVCADYAADAYQLRVSSRVVEPLAFAFLMLATAVNYVVYAQSVYLRAHKEEPFLLPSVTMGLVVSAAIAVVAGKYGAMGMTVAYCMASLLVALPWCTGLFVIKRNAWHGQ